MSSFFDRLKTKWGIKNTLQVVLILIVFSLAGSTAVSLRKMYFAILGIEEATPLVLKIIAYIVLLFPTYQALLLAYGFIFGQFAFFWDKEKKMFNAIFKRNKKNKLPQE